MIIYVYMVCHWERAPDLQVAPSPPPSPASCQLRIPSGWDRIQADLTSFLGDVGFSVLCVFHEVLVYVFFTISESIFLYRYRSDPQGPNPVLDRTCCYNLGLAISVSVGSIEQIDLRALEDVGRTRA